MSPLFLLLLIPVLLLVYAIGFWALHFGLKCKELSKKTKSFNQQKTTYHKKILMIGDSAMHGVGASYTEYTLPGLVSEYSPDALVTTCTKDGARCREILNLVKERKIEPQDQVIIMCGGMDIIKLTSSTEIKRSLGELFLHVKTISSNIIFITPPDTGRAPIFLPPLSHLYTYRAKEFFAIAKQCAKEYDATLIDYYHSKNTHYAIDKSHPNDQGYRDLFDLFKDKVVR